MLPQMSCYSPVSLLFVLLCLTWIEIRNMYFDNTLQVVMVFCLLWWRGPLCVFDKMQWEALLALMMQVYVCLDRNMKSGKVHIKRLMAITSQVMWRKFRPSTTNRSKYHNRKKNDAYVTSKHVQIKFLVPPGCWHNGMQCEYLISHYMT